MSCSHMHTHTYKYTYARTHMHRYTCAYIRVCICVFNSRQVTWCHCSRSYPAPLSTCLVKAIPPCSPLAPSLPHGHACILTALLLAAKRLCILLYRPCSLQQCGCRCWLLRQHCCTAELVTTPLRSQLWLCHLLSWWRVRLPTHAALGHRTPG